jgi:hypothetical protein
VIHGPVEQTLNTLLSAELFARAEPFIRAKAYPSFCNIKRLGALLPLGGTLVHCRVGYRHSFYWYPFILQGWEKQVRLSVLLKDTEKHNVTWLRIESGTSCSEVPHCHYTTAVPTPGFCPRRVAAPTTYRWRPALTKKKIFFLDDLMHLIHLKMQ